MNRAKVYARLKKLPKTDLHRHLEGSITPETMLAIAKKYGGKLPTYDLQKLKFMIQASNDPPGFQNFLSKFKVFRCFYPNRKAIEEVAFRAVQEAAEDSVKYLELRYSPTHFACDNKFSETDVVTWVQGAINRAAEEFSIIVTPVLTISRDYGFEVAKRTVEMVTRLPPGFFYGLDLAGDEASNPARPFAKLFAMAKSAGLGLTIHAGEAGGAVNIREAVVNFHADRIGHGIRAVEDPSLLAMLKEQDRLLEISLTSNLQTGVVSTIDHHPIKKLKQKSIAISLNTDDPAISGITLTDEYMLAFTQLNFSLEDFNALNLSALNHAFYPDQEKLKEMLSPLWE